MLRKNELVNGVKQILYQYGPEAYLKDSDCAKDVVDYIVRCIQAQQQERKGSV